MIDLDNCKCNDKQPDLICFFCWGKGVRPADRPADRLGEPTGPTVCPVPKVVDVKAIDAKLLRYKAQGILDCTCSRDKQGCPTHGEFYGTCNRDGNKDRS